jgi:hypothetical protein
VKSSRKPISDYFHDYMKSTVRKHWAKTMATLGFLVNTAFFSNAMYDFFSVLLVGLGLNSPRYWPPSFSSFLEAYKIR